MTDALTQWAQWTTAEAAWRATVSTHHDDTYQLGPRTQAAEVGPSAVTRMRVLRSDRTSLILSILDGAGEQGNDGGEEAQANDRDSHAAEVARAGGKRLRDGAKGGQGHLALLHHHARLRSAQGRLHRDCHTQRAGCVSIMLCVCYVVAKRVLSAERRIYTPIMHRRWQPPREDRRATSGKGQQQLRGRSPALRMTPICTTRQLATQSEATIRMRTRDIMLPQGKAAVNVRGPTAANGVGTHRGQRQRDLEPKDNLLAAHLPRVFIPFSSDFDELS